MRSKTRRATRAAAAVSVAPRWRATYQSGNSVELAAQQRVVVRRQHALARRALPAHQRVDRVAIQRVRVAVVERLRGRSSCRGRSAAGSRGRGPARGPPARARPASRSSAATCTNGAAILLRRRRVHRDQRRASPRAARRLRERDAEVAAKARVGGGRRERECARRAAPLASQSRRARARRRRAVRHAVSGMRNGRGALESRAILAATALVADSSDRRVRRSVPRSCRCRLRRACAAASVALDRCRRDRASRSRADADAAVAASRRRELAPPAVARRAPLRIGTPRAVAQPHRRRRTAARRAVPARRPARRRRRATIEAAGKRRAAHAPRDGARRLAVVRPWQGRDLGQGQRHAAARLRLDHRPGAQVQARHARSASSTAPRFFIAENDAQRRRRRRSASPGPTSTRRPTRATRRCVAPQQRLVPAQRASSRSTRCARSAPRTTRACYFMDVPVMYSPWLEFPLSNERKSGFLTPTLGSTQHPRLRSVGAVLLQPRAELRRDADAADHDASAACSSAAQFRYLFGDDVAVGGRRGQRRDPARRSRHRRRRATALSWKHNQQFAPWLAGYVNLQQGVRRHVLRRLRRPRRGHVAEDAAARGRAHRDVTGRGRVLARAQSFQTLQDPNQPPVTPPYNRAAAGARRR